MQWYHHNNINSDVSKEGKKIGIRIHCYADPNPSPKSSSIWIRIQVVWPTKQEKSWHTLRSNKMLNFAKHFFLFCYSTSVLHFITGFISAIIPPGSGSASSMRFRIQDVYYNTDPVFVTCLIVGVGEELDHEGEEVGGHDRVEMLRHLLAVHGNVGHLLHQLRPHTRLCTNTQLWAIATICNRIFKTAGFPPAPQP